MENTPDLTFQTNYFLEDSFFSKHCRKKFEIFPNTPNFKWNFTILSCFLNEMSTFQPNRNNPFTTTQTDEGITYTFSFVDYITQVDLQKDSTNGSPNRQSGQEGSIVTSETDQSETNAIIDDDENPNAMINLGTMNNESDINSITANVTDTFDTSNANEDEDDNYKIQFDVKITSSITVIASIQFLKMFFQP